MKQQTPISRYRLFAERVQSLFRRANELPESPTVLSEALDELAALLETLQKIETELQLKQEEQLDARASSVAEFEHYRDLFAHAPIGYLVTRLDGTIRQANAVAERMLHTSERMLIGRSLTQFLPEGQRRTFRAEIERLRTVTGEKTLFVRLQPANGPVVDTVLIGSVVRGRGGQPQAIRWVLQSSGAPRPNGSTDGPGAQNGHLREAPAAAVNGGTGLNARTRYRVLAEASLLPLVPEDVSTVLARLTRLAASFLADITVLDIVDQDAHTRFLATGDHSASPSSVREERYQLELDRVRMAWLLHEGQPRLLNPPTPDLLGALTAVDGLQHAGIPTMSLRSCMIVPIVGTEQAYGAWIFASSEHGPIYGPDDLALAEELALRVGVLIENARRFGSRAARAQPR